MIPELTPEDRKREEKSNQLLLQIRKEVAQVRKDPDTGTMDVAVIRAGYAGCCYARNPKAPAIGPSYYSLLYQIPLNQRTLRDLKRRLAQAFKDGHAEMAKVLGGGLLPSIVARPPRYPKEWR